MGEILGITYGQVSNIERGISEPSGSLLNLVKEKYGENFGLLAVGANNHSPGFYKQTPEKMLPEDRGGEVRPGSYGIPDIKTTGVSKIIVEISPEEMVLLNSIRQLDTSTQKGIFITVMGQLNALEQEKHIRQDKQKKDFLKNCIRELSQAVSQAE